MAPCYPCRGKDKMKTSVRIKNQRISTSGNSRQPPVERAIPSVTLVQSVKVQDQSVQQAARGGGRQAGLDDYNPFEQDNQTKPAAGEERKGLLTETTGQTIPAPQPSPAIMQPSNDPPPYSQSSAQRVDTSELERRQQELEKKAEELARKEQEMKNMQFQDRQNNWPPLPKWFPVGPCFYQDFSVDIPLEFQRTVKFVYYIWMFYGFTLFLNFLGSLAYFIVDSDGGATFGLSILWLILFTPCSFICWYRPLYKAFRSDSSFNFFVFFFIFFFQFCTCILMCLGITDISVGIIGGLGTVGDNVAVGLIMIFVGIFFGIVSVLCFALLVKVHRIYRSTGASFAKAQQEFATGVMKNEAVQSGVQNAASSAAQGAVRGAASQYGTGGKY
ncbi:secretory carrier-associated membrane protein 1-like [Mercenaria mercenaria]|uniref:secretory carrier-associated membrane protein 1-like n=1 Tax=Mercenaria mercenaria TaxID=6596 RepID=UPI00234F9E06|nr:secretory carrier-associated membrane protein 1-like [Mercenaria mercenaria]